MKTLGLALSGGAAKGLAHVRVYETLLKHNIKISSISGASAGALYGAMIAFGYSPTDMLEIINKFPFFKSRIFRLMCVNWNMFNPYRWHPGMFKLNRLYKYLNDEVFMNINIEDLEIPLILSYTDIVENKTGYRTCGNLAEAVVYSMTFPLMFRSYNDRFYDGGLQSNCPVPALKEAYNPDYILAVDVTSISSNKENFRKDLFTFISRVFDVIWKDTFVEDLKYADMLIEPELKGIGFFDFHRYQEVSKLVDTVFDKDKIKKLISDLNSEGVVAVDL